MPDHSAGAPAEERALKRILILLHEGLQPRDPHYLIDALAERWRERGLQVSFVYGTRERPEADLLIPHVDLTRTPPQYADYVRSFPNAINRDVTDISKRRISAQLLRGDEDYDGPVIVKTDCNSGGGHEYRLAMRRHPVLARVRRRAAPVAECVLGRRLAWRSELRDYPVYGSLAQVPAGAFANPALVVEKFLPEREGDRYFVRHYLCLGDRFRACAWPARAGPEEGDLRAGRRGAGGAWRGARRAPPARPRLR